MRKYLEQNPEEIGWEKGIANEMRSTFLLNPLDSGYDFPRELYVFEETGNLRRVFHIFSCLCKRGNPSSRTKTAPIGYLAEKLEQIDDLEEKCLQVSGIIPKDHKELTKAHKWKD